MTQTLTLKDLSSAVAGGVAAFRVVQRLQPAGGPGDKIFPPTYATGDKLKYAVEDRRVDGQTVPCVLVDSVASQANRMEEALQRAWEDGLVDFPVIRIDFTGRDDIRDLDHISTLQAPHRAFDALMRDSVDKDGTLFRDTKVGAALTHASAKAATALYATCPTVLVFGGWDSTGPKGGMGTKVQRALVSEVVAINAQTGVKTASRLDPAGIQSSVAVYHHKDNHDDYTIDADEAQQSKGKPILFNRKGGEGKGKPSAINHSNVAPSIDDLAGGVTCDYALQTTVLSLPALRRLRFSSNVAGETLQGEGRPAAERAARTAVAALGLAAMALLREDGFDFRSRCALIPDSPMVLEAVSADGGEPQRYTLSSAEAASLLKEAHEAASKLGFGWVREPIQLVPSKKLGDLIAKSRELAAAGDQEGAD